MNSINICFVIVCVKANGRGTVSYITTSHRYVDLNRYSGSTGQIYVTSTAAGNVVFTGGEGLSGPIHLWANDNIDISGLRCAGTVYVTTGPGGSVTDNGRGRRASTTAVISQCGTNFYFSDGQAGSGCVIL